MIVVPHHTDERPRGEPVDWSPRAGPVTPTGIRILPSCTACGNCIVTCGEQALTRAPKRPLVIDERCTSCGECIEVCPVGAIEEIKGAGSR